MSRHTQSIGIYIHVPFCLSKCRYCDFYSITDSNRMAEYSQAMLQEMAMVGPVCHDADTLYFGGGTPSLLPAEFLSKIIEKTTDLWRLPADAEITLEMNPATLSGSDLHALKAMGINRLNIGFQSFNPDNLSFLGRSHSPAQAVDAFETARRAGFDNLGIDLIYGLPGQTPMDWKTDLLRGVELHPEHLSCYILSYEPGTPLYREWQSGTVTPLGDGATADLFRRTHRFLKSSGYEHYEISNFARNGYRSRHNQKYWNFAGYLGFGAAAHSYCHPGRWWNHPSLNDYLDDIHAGRQPIMARERLTTEQQLIEMIYLGLRQSDGLDLNRIQQFPTLLPISRLYSDLKRLQAQSLLIIDGKHCRLTAEGMLFLDRIVGELICLIG